MERGRLEASGATQNKIIESYNRYVAETKQRIFSMYSLVMTDTYNLSYWNSLCEYLGDFIVKSKEEALCKYYSWGFDVPNYQKLVGRKISNSELLYEFDGKIIFIDGVEEYTKKHLDRESI